MANKDFENRIRLLYKEVLKSKIDEEECGDNIEALEGLIKDLDSEEIIDEGNFDEISLGGWFSSANEDEIKEANKDILKQLKKIAKTLGIDLDQNTSKNDLNVPQQIIFNANPTMNTQVNISNETKLEIESLVKDFKNELNNSKPNKITLWDIFGKILKLLGFFI